MRVFIIEQSLFWIFHIILVWRCSSKFKILTTVTLTSSPANWHLALVEPRYRGVFKVWYYGQPRLAYMPQWNWTCQSHFYNWMMKLNRFIGLTSMYKLWAHEKDPLSVSILLLGSFFKTITLQMLLLSIAKSSFSSHSIARYHKKKVLRVHAEASKKIHLNIINHPRLRPVSVNSHHKLTFLLQCPCRPPVSIAIKNHTFLLKFPES
jgi:hypothetical protein